MIRINGIRWKIRIVSPSNPQLFTPEGQPAFGCCNNIDKTIYISNKLDRKKLKQVLCHEIVHAVMYSYQVGLTYQEEENVANLIMTYGEEIIDLTNQSFGKIK